MMTYQRITLAKNKLQKFRGEQGTIIFFEKALLLLVKKLNPFAKKQILNKRNLLLNKLDEDILLNDLNQLFSLGLFRPLEKIKNDIRSMPHEHAKAIFVEAKRLLDDSFTIYGHLHLKRDSDRFSWRKDLLTKYEWPDLLGYNSFTNQKPPGTDIKTVWEIARFQFLSPLSSAYIHSGEKKYALFALEKVKSWIEENPFLKGPHWLMPMESAIRLINWSVFAPLLDIFKFAELSEKKMITKSMLEHLIYIRKNLEISFSPEGNHYLSNLVGLLLSRFLFPSVKWAVECTEFAKNKFKQEIEKQFDTSGFYFEGSLPYHRLCSEMALIGFALLKKESQGKSAKVLERMQKAADFTRYYTDICAESPLIGDNDSGVFLKFFPGQEKNRHGYLNCLYDAILDDKPNPNSFDKFACSIHFADNASAEVFKSDTSSKGTRAELQVRKFNGLIIARFGTEALLFNTIPTSQRHSHNDKLSIYPIIGKKLLFIDQGSFSYTGFSDKRFKNRQTASHNCPTINNWEQNTIWQSEPFYNNGEARCFHTIEKGSTTLTITGWHVGYERFRRGLKVFRQIMWNTAKKSILISDWLEGKSSTEIFEYQWMFSINPSWESKVTDGSFIFTNQEQTVYFKDMRKIGFSLSKGHYCPSYQNEQFCDVLKASLKSRLGKKISFCLNYS
jgi:hypothetical protein